MNRIQELEARRRALLARIDEQRAEIVYRFEQIRPATQVANWAGGGASGTAASHPLAWLAGLAGLVVMLRPRKLLSWVTFASGVLSLVSRAGTILRMLATLRALRAGFR
jgi:hypothetical protein